MKIYRVESKAEQRGFYFAMGDLLMNEYYHCDVFNSLRGKFYMNQTHHPAPYDDRELWKNGWGDIRCNEVDGSLSSAYKFAFAKKQHLRNWFWNDDVKVATKFMYHHFDIVTLEGDAHSTILGSHQCVYKHADFKVLDRSCMTRIAEF